MKDSLDINLTTADTKAVKVEVLEAPEELTLQDYGDEAAAWLEKATDISKCRPEFNQSSQSIHHKVMPLQLQLKSWHCTHVS